MKIVYRSLRAEEALKFWKMMNALDYETKFMLYEPGERRENEESLFGIKMMIEKAMLEEQFLLVAECGDDGGLAGYLSAQKGSLNRILHTAYIVVGIREKYRGQGIGTELFKRLDIWAKEHKVTRLELTVMCPNTVAKRLYEKQGFVVEGIKKKAVLVDGEYVDEYYMAKLL